MFCINCQVGKKELSTLCDYSTSAMNFMFAVCNWLPNCQQLYKAALGNFLGLSQDERQAEFAKNLRPSPFNTYRMTQFLARSISLASTF